MKVAILIYEVNPKNRAIFAGVTVSSIVRSFKLID